MLADTQLGRVDYTHGTVLRREFCDFFMGPPGNNCPCMADSRNVDGMRLAREHIAEYNGVLRRLVEEFNDAALATENGNAARFVLQPFAEHTELSDLAFISADCFHPSIRGQSLFAQGLWNNMMQPVGQKSTSISEADGKICPGPGARL